MSQALLETRALCKSYSAPVLREFDFDLRAGEVHALVGSNGAGKSTFARILSGFVHADAGQMFLQGRPHAPESRRQAERAGVIMVVQELNVIPTLTVAENLFLDRLPATGGFIKYSRLHESARAALDRVGLAIDPSTLASSLSVAQQQMVEIASALARKCSVLILDEPTAALTAPEIEALFENIRRLREQGKGVIYISHRMHEIREIADRVTVLRDGRRIATHPAGQIGQAQLVREMAGHEVGLVPAGIPEPSGAVMLAVSGVSSGESVHNVSFEVRQGEILGVSGLVGSGRSELLRAIYDSSCCDKGEVRLEGRKVSGGPARSAEAGLCFVPEDRKTEGLLLPLSVRFNLVLSSLDAHKRFGLMSETRELETASALTKELDIRAFSAEQPAVELSGGNQQKIVLGRWLARNSRVLLLDEPTRGVDAAAKDQIHEVLRKLARAGKGVVVVSSELEELMSLCTRILVLSAGRITGEFLPGAWSKEAITDAAFAGYSRPVSG